MDLADIGRGSLGVSASTVLIVVGFVLIILGALFPTFVWFFAKMAETPQTGPGPMGSERYKEGSERNTRRVRREAAAMQRSVRFVCPGLVVLGVLVGVAGAAIGH
jgi:hypothetical protein